MENQVVAPEAVAVEMPAVAVEAQVDKTIELGSIGKIEIDFSEGKALISLSAAVPGNVGIEAGAFIKCDAEKLVEAIAEAIKAKLPDAADPIAETVKDILVLALKTIK